MSDAVVTITKYSKNSTVSGTVNYDGDTKKFSNLIIDQEGSPTNINELVFQEGGKIKKTHYRMAKSKKNLVKSKRNQSRRKRR